MTKRILAAALLAACATPAAAQVWFPVDGIWQIDGANGSGLTLDVRDNAIGIGLYTYDDEGNATWYSGAGELVEGNLHADLARFEDGSTTAVDMLPLTLQFQTSAVGMLTLGDGEAHALRHFAFGSEYIGGLEYTSVAGVVDTIPDLRGRWVISPTRADLGGSFDVSFVRTDVVSGSVLFSTASSAGGEMEEGEHWLSCGPGTTTEGPQHRCTLYRSLGLSPPALPPTALAEFDAADLAATRIVSMNNDFVGFRVPGRINEPQSGIWQIAGRNGQGVTIDVRQDLVAIGVYGYDGDGNASWSLATGPLDGDVVDASLATFTGGSCVNCEQSDPTVAATRDVRLEFVGATRARLTIGDDEPLALSLLPFGAAYLDKPFGGDPGAEEFGTHALPTLAGAWVQADIYAQYGVDLEPHYPSNAFTYGDVETISLDGDTLNGLLAIPEDAWGPPSELGAASVAPSIACEVGIGDDVADCDLIHPGGDGSPPSGPTDIATIEPWNISATRISGVNTDSGVTLEPVYLFRIPPRPAPASTR